MSFGSPQGSARWIAELDVTKFTQGANTLKQDFTSLGQQTRALAQGVAPLSNSFNPLTTNITKTSQSFGILNNNFTQVKSSMTGVQTGLTDLSGAATKTSQNFGILNNHFTQVKSSTAGVSGAAKDMIVSQNNLGNSVSTTSDKLSKAGGFLKNNLTSVGLLAGGIANLDNQYLALHKAQVANERAQLMSEKADQRVVKAKEALNKMIAEGKQGTTEYNIKLKDYQIAQDAANIATERATVAQENLGERTEDFWISILPNALFIAGSAADLVRGLGVNMKTLSGLGGGLKGVMITLSGAFAGVGTDATVAAGGVSSLRLAFTGLLGPVALVLGGIYAIMFAMKAAQGISDDVTLAYGDQAQSMSILWATYLRGKQFFGVANEEEKKALAQWDKQMAESDKLKEKAIARMKEAAANPLPDEWSANIIKQMKPLIDLFNGASQGISDVGATAADTAPQVDTLNESVDNTIFAASDAVVAVINHRDALTARQATMEKDKQYYEYLLSVGNQSATTTDNQTGKVIQLSKAEALLAQKMNADLTPAELADIEAQKQRYIQLQLTTSSVEQLTTAESEGVKQFTETVSGLIDGTAAANNYRDRLVAWATQEKGIKDAANLTNEQIIDRINLMEDNNKKLENQQKLLEEWKKFATEFNKQGGLRDMFDFKIDQKDVTKDWFKDVLTKKQEKAIKLRLKFDLEDESINQAIKNIASGLLKAGDDGKFHLRFAFDPKTAEEDAKNLKEKIDAQLEKEYKKTGKQDPLQRALSDKIKDALKDGITESEWQEILEMMAQSDTPEITVGIAPASITQMSTDIANKIGDVMLNGVIGGVQYGGGKGSGWSSAGSFNEAEGSLVGGKMLTNTPVGSVPLTGVVTSIAYELDVEGSEKQLEEKKKKAEQGGGGGTTGGGPGVTMGQIRLDNTLALKAVDAVAKRIMALTDLSPFVHITNQPSLKGVGVIAQNIENLSRLSPPIHVTNQPALKGVGTVGQRIEALSKLSPDIHVSNQKALSGVDAVAKRIMKLEDLSPTVHVQVEYDGIQSFQHGGHFITNGPQIIQVGDNPSGREEVTVKSLPGGEQGQHPYRGGGSLSYGGFGGTQNIHIHNVIMDREVIVSIQRRMGDRQSRFI